MTLNRVAVKVGLGATSSAFNPRVELIFEATLTTQAFIQCFLGAGLGKVADFALYCSGFDFDVILKQDARHGYRGNVTQYGSR